MIDLPTISNAFPVEGKIVRLGLFTAANVTSEYLGWLNDPETVRFSDQRFSRHTAESSLAYLDACTAAGDLFLTVHVKSGMRYVGTMSAHFAPAHGTADIGILIGDKTCWGTGVGGDAWRTLKSLLLGPAGVRKVTGGTVRCNTGMVRIMMNSGMQADGVRLAQQVIDGRTEDIVHFAEFRRA